MKITKCWTAIFALAYLAASRLPAAEARGTNQAEALAITHGPCLQGPRETSMTVVWWTSKPCLSWVEYGEGEDLSMKAISAHHGLMDANTPRHAIEITGLKPGHTYRYRVASREILSLSAYKTYLGKAVASEFYSFTTCDANKENFSFFVVSDVHQHAKMLEQMFERVPWAGVDLVFLNGDMVKTVDKASQVFDGFLDTCVARFARTIPMVYVRGNHEARGLLARQFMDFAPTPEGRFYYSFDHGGVHFIVMDSGEDVAVNAKVRYGGLNLSEETSKPYGYVGMGMDAFEPYLRAQEDWLRRDLESDAFRAARYRVALFHIPPVNHGRFKLWRGMVNLWNRWRPILNEGGVDVVLCGHTHEALNLPPADGVNRYHLLVGSTNMVIQAEVTKHRLSLRATEADGKVSATVDLPARRLK